MSRIGQQAQAVMSARKIVCQSGGKPSSAEKEWLGKYLAEAELTLRWLESREADIKDALNPKPHPAES